MENIRVKVNIRCPKCDSPSRIYDSKFKPSLAARLRYRECVACSHTFKTIQFNDAPESLYKSSRKESVKFTVKDVIYIRDAYWNQGLSSVKLAKEFDCAKTSITRIINNKVYANIR